VIVLPWWQHPVNIVTMVLTAAILASMVGWMVGDNANRTPHDDVDAGFLQDMRLHHEQAIFMGFVYRDLPDTDPELRAVAASIVQGQSLEVGRMIQLLRSFGEAEARDLDETGDDLDGHGRRLDAMPGMASEAELEALIASSGVEADELFVRLMTEHHVGGIEMAEFAAERAANDEVRLMAASMAELPARRDRRAPRPRRLTGHEVSDRVPEQARAGARKAGHVRVLVSPSKQERLARRDTRT
jgi:uncharacterized protein (DUF305 family)